MAREHLVPGNVAVAGLVVAPVTPAQAGSHGSADAAADSGSRDDPFGSGRPEGRPGRPSPLGRPGSRPRRAGRR